MAAIEDLKNELYTLNSSRWSDSLGSLLELLSFPVSLSKSFPICRTIEMSP